MKLTFIPKKQNIAVMIEADSNTLIASNASGHTPTPGNDVTTGSRKAPIASNASGHTPTPDNDVTTGSRKAPQMHHFYSEIRLNPDALALILRPRATLTRYASEWQHVRVDGTSDYYGGHSVDGSKGIHSAGHSVDGCKGSHSVGHSDDRFIIEDTSTFGIGIYKLMGWENTRAYSIPGTVVASHFKSAAELRTATGRSAVETTFPDTARIGDYYFNLKEAGSIALSGHDHTPDHDHAFDHDQTLDHDHPLEHDHAFDHPLDP